MNEKNKIVAGWLAFVFLVIHFLLIFFYASPYGYVPEKSKEISKYYVTPIFDQEWSMFAPCPYKDFSVRMKYTYEDGEESEWVRPAEDAIYWHSILRLSHHGEIALTEANIMYWVDVDLEELGIETTETMTDEMAEEFKERPSWNLLSRYAYGASATMYGKYPKSALIEINRIDVRDYSSGTILLPEFKWN